MKAALVFGPAAERGDCFWFPALFFGAGCVFSIAAVAQLVERVLGKDEVMGSNPISS